MNAQTTETYCDFDGVKKVTFGHYTGVLDSNAANPAIGLGNTSLKSGKYIRDTAAYDNLKVYPMTKLADVSAFASASGPKITMKVYSTMPAGSKIELQLGNKYYIGYPAGVHSQYTTQTTSSKTWETVSFNYMLSPSGSSVTAIDIDKVVLFFRPASNSRDTIYFDDITGPVMTPVGISELNNNAFEVGQNTPNPAGESTSINLNLTSSENVQLSIYSISGQMIRIFVYDNLHPGRNQLLLNTGDFPNGIYIYEVRQGDNSRKQKMSVLR
jgi:hypothetical protein